MCNTDNRIALVLDLIKQDIELLHVYAVDGDYYSVVGLLEDMQMYLNYPAELLTELIEQQQEEA